MNKKEKLFVLAFATLKLALDVLERYGVREMGAKTEIVLETAMAVLGGIFSLLER